MEEQTNHGVPWVYAKKIFMNRVLDGFPLFYPAAAPHARIYHHINSSYPYSSGPTAHGGGGEAGALLQLQSLDRRTKYIPYGVRDGAMQWRKHVDHFRLSPRNLRGGSGDKL